MIPQVSHSGDKFFSYCLKCQGTPLIPHKSEMESEYWLLPKHISTVITNRNTTWTQCGDVPML